MVLRNNPTLSALIASCALPHPLDEQVGAVLAKAEATYERWPDWPVPEIARRGAAARGADERVQGDLALAAVLFYCAADITDDAQDDELAANPAWRAWDWRQAVNVGHLFIFLSGRVLDELKVAPQVKAAWAAEFHRAGVRLARGQSRDFLAGPDWDCDEDQLLALSADKAGAACACYATLGSHWAGDGEEARLAWYRMGEALGTIYQVASDVRPYLFPLPHPDLAVGKLTLPLHYAREQDPTLSECWSHGTPLRPREQSQVRRRVAEAGGLLYASMKVDVLKAEAHERLAAIDCPGADALFAPLIDAVTLDPTLAYCV